MKIPRRKWIVESRPAMFPDEKWQKSLGPYFKEQSAHSNLRLMRMFVPGSIVALRVRKLS